jgi:hypothetical protein
LKGLVFLENGKKTRMAISFYYVYSKYIDWYYIIGLAFFDLSAASDENRWNINPKKVLDNFLYSVKWMYITILSLDYFFIALYTNGRMHEGEKTRFSKDQI